MYMPLGYPSHVSLQISFLIEYGYTFCKSMTICLNYILLIKENLLERYKSKPERVQSLVTGMCIQKSIMDKLKLRWNNCLESGVERISDEKKLERFEYGK